ncbi:MAG: hypothetical protein JNL09_02710 [Anaerolineales bacterium]|nr:hypothetical protein [Anaerolineales bacterium]
MSHILSLPTLTDFTPYLNDYFELVFDVQAQRAGFPAHITFQLTEAEALPRYEYAAPHTRAGFSLIFAMPLFGPRGTQYLPQSTYTLQHPALGQLSFFMVPLGPQAGQMRYQVIFN